MAIFDSNKKHYLDYFVHLTDKDRVEELTTGSGGTLPRYNLAPKGEAETFFDAEFVGYREPLASLAPFIWTPWSNDGSTGKPYPVDQRSFSRHTGGFLGIGGTTVNYYWMATIVYAPPLDGGGVTLPEEEANIPKRRWIEGFETPGAAAMTNLSGNGLYYSRDAARHVGGIGLALRGPNNVFAEVALDKYIAPVDRTKSWERFYIRLRRAPSATRTFWASRSFPSAAVGVVLGITAAGQIAVYSSNASSVLTLHSVLSDVPLEEWDGTTAVNAWKRIDILVSTGDSSPVVAGSYRIFVDGELKATVATAGADYHLSSRLGGLESISDSDLYLDVDDWHNAEIPQRTIGGSGVEMLNGKDWLNGTKVVLIRPSALNTLLTTFTGDVRALMQNPVVSVLAPTDMAGAGPAPSLQVTTDSVAKVDGDPGAIGVAAMQVIAFSRRGAASNNDAKLGYTVGTPPAATDATISQTTSNTAASVIFNNDTSEPEGGGRPELVPVTPINLRHTGETSAVAKAISSLLAQVELVGRWGGEDYTPEEREGLTLKPAAMTGQHNAPYPKSPWALLGSAAPIAPIIVHGGTYAGNGTGQDLHFRAPVSWLWIRPLTASGGGSLWLSPMLASHESQQEGIRTSIVAVEEDPDFVGAAGDDAQQVRYRVRIQGTNAQFNASGVTYQYIAFMDPGMRFCLNAPFSSKGVTPATAEDTKGLVRPSFEADWAFLACEIVSSSTTRRLYAKGPGHEGTESIVNFAPATITDALNLDAPGVLVTKAALHALGNGEHQVFSLWRRDDGSQDTGIPRVVNIGSYVGDGSASRSIGLSPAANRRPMFAMVFAASGASSYTRDPSHTGTNSANNTGADVATGITAGAIDGFTVASGLNANGVIYNYFVFFGPEGCTGNNGWGCNGEVVPVEPTPVNDDLWPPDPEDPEEPEYPDPPIDPPINPPDFDVECYKWSTYLSNLALQRIGVSVQIEDLRTDAGVEAYQIRQAYAFDIERVLRDFPWPFATKYLTLDVTAGSAASPANRDWRYAYRWPGDSIFERRLVKSRSAAVDPTPPPFTLGTYGGETVIFSNEASAVLEYTYRMDCPAQKGDPLFREAFVWRLAATLAGSISRDAEKAKHCLAMYEQSLVQAEAVHRPGKPGVPEDLVDAESADKLAITNRALLRIGARTIADWLTDQSREAQAARLLFSGEYEATLRDFPWSFATAYAELVVVDGAADDPVNPDWTYSYRLPTDVVAVRRMADEDNRRWEPSPSTFSLARDATGGLLFTHETVAQIEYTAVKPLAQADALFIDALTWRLAAALAPSVLAVDLEQPEQLGRGPDTSAHTQAGRRPSRPEAAAQIRRQTKIDAWLMYQEVLGAAKTASAREQQQEPSGDAPWIEGR